MKTEITISSTDAYVAMQVIWEAIKEGASQFDLDALHRVHEALAEADRIVIEVKEGE